MNGTTLFKTGSSAAVKWNTAFDTEFHDTAPKASVLEKMLPVTFQFQSTALWHVTLQWKTVTLDSYSHTESVSRLWSKILVFLVLCDFSCGMFNSINCIRFKYSSSRTFHATLPEILHWKKKKQFFTCLCIMASVLSQAIWKLSDNVSESDTS